MRKTTSKQFRDLFKKHFPRLGKNESYWRFMRLLIFGRKDEQGRPILSRRAVAKVEGKLPQLENNNGYCAEEFLSKFQEDVMGLHFIYSDYSYEEGEARVAYINWPKEIEEAIGQEVFKLCEERIYFDTGKKFNAKSQKADREVEEREALYYFHKASEESKPVLEYMNGLNVNSFTKTVTANWSAAWAAAGEIDNEIKRKANCEILQRIREQLKPTYIGSKQNKTVRVFPHNVSIPMLSKDIRLILCRGWWDADLDNSQLAIAAKVWGIPEIEAFLQTGVSIWEPLIQHYGFSADLEQTNNNLYKAVKRPIKKALYSLMFGKTVDNLKITLDEELGALGIERAGHRFFQHPLMKVLLTARSKRMRLLNQTGEVTTIFGKVLKVTGAKTKSGAASSNRKASIRSILAEEAQAIELWLLLPVLDLAKSTNDFVITLWQHDGFSVNFTSEGRRERWIKRMQETVAARIDELGLFTKLRFKELKETEPS